MIAQLTPAERKWRVLSLALIPITLFALRIIPPGSLWLPFPTSCDAITGLPCIFCGTTRAMHHLLQGEFGRALYYNWLAFPLLAGAGAAFLFQLLELVKDRNLLVLFPRPRLTRRSLGATVTGFVVLWSLQVYFAVSQHKSELLNPNGPLYSLVVR